MFLQSDNFFVLVFLMKELRYTSKVFSGISLIGDDGSYANCNIADYMAGGVTPALNLKSTLITSVGNGTLESPYTFPYTATPTPNSMPIKVNDLEPENPKDSVVSGDAAIKIMINGKELLSDTAPFTQSGRVLVPLRAIFEALGATVTWNAESQTAMGCKELTCIILQPDNKNALILVIKSDFIEEITFENLEQATESFKTVTLDVLPAFKNSRLMVPARFIAESLGAKVDWDDKTCTVIITTLSGGDNTPAASQNSDTSTDQNANSKMEV